MPVGYMGSGSALAGSYSFEQRLLAGSDTIRKGQIFEFLLPFHILATWMRYSRDMLHLNTENYLHGESERVFWRNPKIG
jgi:hypothetical protein